MRYATLLLCVLAAGSLFAAPVHAVELGAEVYGSFNTYQMGDWNDLVDESNAAGANFDNINNGISGGIGARVWANPNVMVAATWEPLFASTEDMGMKANLDANAFLATVAYMVPNGNAKYGVGVGGGIYSISGKLESPGDPSIDLGGSTFGFHFLGLAEWTVSPGFGVTAGAGYRVAKIDDTEADGQSVNPKIATDYSGFTGRVGVAFYLPMNH